MKILALSALAMLIAAIAPALAQQYENNIPPPVPGEGPLKQDEIAFFLDESYGRYWDQGNETDWEDALYLAMEADGSPAEITARFAKAVDLAPRNADLIVRAIVELVKLKNDCTAGNNGEPTYDCRFEPGAPAYDALNPALNAEPSGQLAFIAVKAVPEIAAWQGALLDMLSDHPGRFYAFRQMFAYSNDRIWFGAIALETLPDPDMARLIFERFSSRPIENTTDYDGTTLAILEDLLGGDGIDTERRAYLVSAYIMLLQKTGLTEEAFAVYLAEPEAVQHFSPDMAGLDAGEKDNLARSVVKYRVGMAGLLLNAGKKKMAIDNLAIAESMLGHFILDTEYEGHGKALLYQARINIRTLREVASPSLTQAEIYDYFIHGKTANDPAIAIKPDRYFAQTPGWLFALDGLGPAGKAVVADYLDVNGYVGMADYLHGQWLYYHGRRAGPHSDMLNRLFDEALTARRTHWQERQEAALAAYEQANNDAAQTNFPAYPDWHEERPLSVQLQSAPGSDIHNKRHEPDLPEQAVVPVTPHQVVRYGTERGEQQIVYLSSDFDAPGEVPAYGYWFRQTENGEWQEPLYLGFQRYFPYEVLSRSRLAMLGDGALFLEVERKEIDPESITFPPVGIEFKERTDNLYLVLPFDKLTQDDDADGLSNLVEQRIMLASDSPDTDEDDIPDGRDPLPLTAFDPTATAQEKELAYALLSEIIGYESGALMVGPGPDGAGAGMEDMIARALGEARETIEGGATFMVGNPELFAGIQVPFRLIILTEGQVEAINAQGAPFYPVGIRHMFSRPDGSERYVIWSASWVGGEFIIRCDNGECETEVTRAWIT